MNFFLWSEEGQKACTRKVPGLLTNISRRGACLQTDHIQIGDYHLMRDTDPEGKTLLNLEIPQTAEGAPWSIKAQVLSYDKISEGHRFQFGVRLQFFNVAPSERQNLETLIKSASVEKP